LLQYNPAYRLELELTRKSLRVAVDAGSTNLTDLQDALSHLPVSQLQGTNGAVLVSGGVTILDNTQRLIAKVDTKNLNGNLVLPLMRGLLAGLNQALGPETSSLERGYEPRFMPATLIIEAEPWQRNWLWFQGHCKRGPVSI
jgi:hypothetical protein